MKHWQETAQIVERALKALAAERPGALATVVRISGSAYRRPGAKLLVEDDGRTLGGVSGGCLEADVREVALALMRTGSSRLLHYQTGSDEGTLWGLGLGCNGSVDVLVQPLAEAFPADVALAARSLLEGDAPFSICSIVEGDHLGRCVFVTAGGVVAGSTGRSAVDLAIGHIAAGRLTGGASSIDRIGDQQVFIEVLTPPPSLLVLGAGDDARPLVGCAAECGFRVTVVDHRPAFLTADRFPDAYRLDGRRAEEGLAGLAVDERSAVVIQTHSLTHDREWLRQIAPSEAAYVGLLGPQARRDELLDQIGIPDRRRVFGPVGLDLGADGPEQIAVAIVAEILAVQAGREPGHLRDRKAVIHAG